MRNCPPIAKWVGNYIAEKPPGIFIIRNRSIIPRTGKEKSLENGARKV